VSADRDTATQAVELARRAGADGADAWLVAEQNSSVTIRNGAIERFLDTTSRTVGLRVFVGERTGLVYSSDLGSRALARLAEQAVELAKLVDPDPCSGLPEGPFATGNDAAALGIYDAELFDHEPQRLVALARRAEAAARGHDRRITTSDGAAMSRRRKTSTFANSRGFVDGYQATSCDLSVSVIADDEDNKKRPGDWSTMASSLVGLDDAEVVGRTAAARALRQLGARKVPTQEVPVVWSPEMAREFVGILAAAASGEARYRGFSFLIGREGERLASPLVTVADDATLSGRLGSRPFDGEGLPSRRTTLFADGRFNGFLFDTYSARKAGRTSTASAARTMDPLVGMTVGVAPSNLALSSGDTTPEAIIGGVERGLYLTELLGSGDNLTTGDFSRGAGGIWIEGGALAYPIAEVNVAGRLQDMLADIDAVGSDQEVLGGTAAPTFRIGRMMVSGT
jgi:PmbA protein